MDTASALAILAISTCEELREPREYSQLTNDQDRIKCVLQWLHDNIIPRDVRTRKKNDELAESFIDLGCSFIDPSDSRSIYEAFTAAIAYAPTGSNTQALAYFDRARMWRKVESYEDCLLDVERGLKIGYSDTMLGIVYAEQAYAMAGLNLEITTEIHDIITKARAYIDNTPEPDRPHLQNFLDTLILNPPRTRCQLPFIRNSLISESAADNLKILGASSAIEFKYKEKHGRHIVATRDIKAGECISSHRAYISIPGDKFQDAKPCELYKYCWNCSKRVKTSVPCNQCASVIFCNEKCRDEAWKEHHDMECETIPEMMAMGMQHTELMALRLIIKAYKEAGSLEDLKKMIDKLNSNKGEIFIYHFKSMNLFIFIIYIL